MLFRQAKCNLALVQGSPKRLSKAFPLHSLDTLQGFRCVEEGISRKTDIFQEVQGKTSRLPCILGCNRPSFATYSRKQAALYVKKKKNAAHLQGDLLSCRGPATEVVGVLCQAVGAGPLHHSLPSFMEAAFQV